MAAPLISFRTHPDRYVRHVECIADYGRVCLDWRAADAAIVADTASGSGVGRLKSEREKQSLATLLGAQPGPFTHEQTSEVLERGRAWPSALFVAASVQACRHGGACDLRGAGRVGVGEGVEAVRRLS